MMLRSMASRELFLFFTMYPLTLYLAAAGPLSSHHVDAQEIRTVVRPNDVRTPDQAQDLFFPMFTAPSGRFVGSVRWQGADIVSAPSDYDASKDTGFRPPRPLSDWQVGPALPGRRSTYQAYRHTVGILSLTHDSPWPRDAPPAASKHASYGFTFLVPYPVFQDPEPWALMLQAKVTVPTFVPLDNVEGTGGEVEFPLGLLYFVLEFRESASSSLRRIPWSVVIFDSRGDLKRERIFVDPSNRLLTVTSRLSADRKGKLYTSLAKGSAALTGIPFSQQSVMRFYITPENFRNAIDALNRKGGGLSAAISDYSLVSFGIVQEQALQEGDESEMAATISHMGLYEADPEYYGDDIERSY